MVLECPSTPVLILSFEPLELKAQIEETYGPPSRVEINGREMTLTYAWGEEGFIADLDALPILIHEQTIGSGTVRQTEYKLCSNAQHEGESAAS